MRSVLSRSTVHPVRQAIAIGLLAVGVPVFCLATFTANLSHAQQAIPAASERFGPLTPEKRAELTALLRRHSEVLEAQATVVKTVSKLIGPTVVHIEADTKQHRSLQMGRGRHVEEAGSGVVVELAGKKYVLTNRHVINGASLEGIKITYADGRRVHPNKVWDDSETDVAVMAVTDSDLVAAPIGDSDAMDIGDFVLAVGSPFGLSHSVTFGIISAKGRRDLELGDAVRFQDFLQTDAAINPGNSGGPLVNLRGEVIGINTAIASNSGGNEGIGFSIPVNMFVMVARQLIDRGMVVRAFMGVSLEREFGPAMAAELGLPRPSGALVNAITAGSPAERAELRVGDVILEFNRVSIESDSHLVNLVSMTEVGKRVPLVIFRNRQTVRMDIEVGDRSKFNAKPASDQRPSDERR